MKHYQGLRTFFLLAFGLSWLFWVPAAWIGEPVMTFPWILLVIAGGLGPALAEMIIMLRSKETATRKDYLDRVTNPRRIPWRWLLVIVLACPVINFLAINLDWAVSGSPPVLTEIQVYLAEPLRLIPLAIFLFLFGPLPEELGWRGFALDAMQTRWNALVSSLILGSAWVVWHLPLFFMQGTFQHELGFGTPGFGWFCLSTLASSVLLTWIYNNTHRSTLAAILFHFMTNFSGELFPLSDQARLYQGMLSVALAVAVAFLYRPAYLMRNPAKVMG